MIPAGQPLPPVGRPPGGPGEQLTAIADGVTALVDRQSRIFAQGIAPAAAHLAAGVDPASLGPALDPASLARLDVPVAVQGTKLEVRGKNLKAGAIAHTLPFDDVEKKKRTAIG